MPQPNDLSRSLVALDQNSTIIAVVELSHSSWLVAGVVPGIERQPRKKLEPSPERLLVEAHVIHASSVAVSREHRRAKTDRLDTELLKRGFLGWLRGERGHCSMARLPTIAEDRGNRVDDLTVGLFGEWVSKVTATESCLYMRNRDPSIKTGEGGGHRGGGVTLNYNKVRPAL